jgi:hypothetical protein
MNVRDRSRREIREIWITLALIVLLSTFVGLVTGCAAFTTPQTLDQRLAAAYTTHTAVVEATANAVAFGDISADQAQNVLDIALRTRVILDSARVALGVGDIQTAEGQLQLALAILAELQAHLRSRT